MYMKHLGLLFMGGTLLASLVSATCSSKDFELLDLDEIEAPLRFDVLDKKGYEDLITDELLLEARRIEATFDLVNLEGRREGLGDWVNGDLGENGAKEPEMETDEKQGSDSEKKHDMAIQEEHTVNEASSSSPAKEAAEQHPPKMTRASAKRWLLKLLSKLREHERYLRELPRRDGAHTSLAHAKEHASHPSAPQIGEDDPSSVASEAIASSPGKGKAALSAAPFTKESDEGGTSTTDDNLHRSSELDSEEVDWRLVKIRELRPGVLALWKDIRDPQHSTHSMTGRVALKIQEERCQRLLDALRRLTDLLENVPDELNHRVHAGQKRPRTDAHMHGASSSDSDTEKDYFSHSYDKEAAQKKMKKKRPTFKERKGTPAFPYKHKGIQIREYGKKPYSFSSDSSSSDSDSDV